MIQNYETTGSKRPNLSERHKSVPLIVNEDYTMLIYVTSPKNTTTGKGVIPFSVNGIGSVIIEGEKLWDTSQIPKKFYFTLRYTSAQAGYPNGSEIENGQIIPIHRTGEFAGIGGYGYEIHTPNEDKTSWVAFVMTPEQQANNALLIKDLGDGNGIIIEYQNGVWVEIGVAKPLMTTGGANFYGSPFLNGNIYIGSLANDKYYVSRSGYGTAVNTITVGNITLMTDCEGRVVSFEGI